MTKKVFQKITEKDFDEYVPGNIQDFLLLDSLFTFPEISGPTDNTKALMQLILIYRYGLFNHDPHTYKSIAKILGCRGREYMSQMHKKALRHFRRIWLQLPSYRFLIHDITNQKLYKEITGEDLLLAEKSIDAQD